MEKTRLFWDFTPLLSQSVLEVSGRHERQFGNALRFEPRTDDANWSERNWRNIPGIVYTGVSDNCLTGRAEAPQNVLYDEEGREFVFRQPRDESEVRAVICAGMFDPFDGYGFDGHRRWTVDLVRQWWRGKSKLLSWIAWWKETSKSNSWFAAHSQKLAFLAEYYDAIVEFESFLNEEAEDYLRTFAFFLANGRCAANGDALPDLV